MNQKERSKFIKKCDSVFSLIIRARDGKCLKCGTTRYLQCAHIINRGNMAHRWDGKSAITFCYGCHIHWWHKQPLEAHDWLKENYPKVYSYYKKHKNDTLDQPIDFESLLKNLKEKLKEMGGD